VRRGLHGVADVGVTVEEDTAELKHTTPMPSGSEGLRLGGDRERVLSVRAKVVKKINNARRFPHSESFSRNVIEQS